MDNLGFSIASYFASHHFAVIIDIWAYNLFQISEGSILPDINNMTESNEKMPPPDTPDDSSTSEQQMTKEQKIIIEREQEQKLKAKYPQAPRSMAAGPGLGAPGGGAGGGGHSAFLQKRLAKGQKYFDSGDYQMAKQKPRPGAPGRMMIPVLAQPPTGDTIPTPDTVPARKTSIIQPLHDHR